MAPAGVEIALGVHHDPDFGPLLMIASGGTLVELSRNKLFTLCPVTEHEIEKMLWNLDMSPLFDGYRDQPPLDRTALAATIRSLSALAWSTRDRVQSIDINPVVVHPGGAVAVDALVQKKSQ
jgi:hypothetical protein